MFLIQDASAQGCKTFGPHARAMFGNEVAALRRIEHEASDRLKGLDTRPFDVLAAEAREAVAVIAEPVGLRLEEELKRCRNATKPIRKICAEGAQMLVDILDKHVTNPKPDYDKPRYAEAIAACEKLMSLKTLKSGIRGTE